MRLHLIFVALPTVLLAQAPAVHPPAIGSSALANGARVAVPERVYSAMRWRMIGPFRGGRVLAVAGVPGDPTTFYFGAVNGGVWKTTNAGLTWDPIFDDQPATSIGALAIAPSDPKVIYVGTGEADMRSDITCGAGVFKSVDGGAHWVHLGLDDTRQIGRIAIDPRNPDVVFVAALGHAYGANEERGVFRSTDGGRSWTRVLHRNADVGAIDVAIDPADPRTLFAVTWNARRTPWSQYPPVEGPGSGLFKSIDGGTTWTELTGHGLPSGGLGRMGIALASTAGATAHGTRAYLLVTSQRGAGAGLYRSDDGGSTWTLASTDRRIVERGWYFGQVFVDPLNPDIVYAPNVSLLRSTDAGKTFVSFKGAPGGDDYHDLWIDPRTPSRMIAGVDQGATVTVDGGRTWSSWNNQPTAQFYHVAVDNRFPYGVYGAQQDSGTVGTTSRSNDGSITFRDWHPVGAGEGGYIAPDPVDPNIVYGGDTYGQVFRYDRTTGQSHVISPWPVSPWSTPTTMPQRRFRFTWTSPLVFDPFDKRALYIGSQSVLRTIDGGLRWDPISPDLTASRVAPGAVASDEPPTIANAAERGWGVIYTIAPSPLKAGVMWVGTDDGLIHLTRDGGAHWRNVTPTGLQPWSKVALIEASPCDLATAYAAVDRHRLDDIAPYYYRTRDYGQHWTRIDEGIPAGAYAQAIREDPARPGLLYAGTELGVFVSFDAGDHWQSLRLNMPCVSVRDLVVHDNDLVVATHGRSFWILDDLTLLQQVGDHVMGATPILFAPERAMRVRRSTNTDTPLAPEEPQGENPPEGAIIDYWLPTASDDPLMIEVFAANGTLVRRVSSEDKDDADVAAQFPDVWLPRPSRPTRLAGHNRFVWDLRYPRPSPAASDYSIAATASRGTVKVPEGPLVSPGVYRVKLTLGGTSYAQPLRVELDPRVHVTSRALSEQLTLALDICKAIADERSLHTAVTTAAHRPPGGDSAAREDGSSSSGVLEDIANATKGGALSDILTAVTSADREPTRQMREAFVEATARLAALRQQWQAIDAKLRTAPTGVRK